MPRGLIAGLFAVAVALTPARAVEAQTENEFAIWAALFMIGQLEPKAPSLTFWLDLHARRGDGGTVHILRPGLGYRIKPWVSLWAGYAWVPEFFDATGERIDEHRVWEQAFFSHITSSGFSIAARSRFEQRFSRGGVAHRFRQFVRFRYRPKNSAPVGIELWDELFLGMAGDPWAKRGLDQNRLFIGPTVFTLEGKFLVAAGYLFVYKARAINLMTHALAVNLMAKWTAMKE